MVKRQHRANQWPYCRNKLSIYRNVRCVMFRIYLRPALIIYVWQHLKKSNKSMHKSNITEIYYNFFYENQILYWKIFFITNIFIKNEIIVIVFSFIKKYAAQIKNIWWIFSIYISKALFYIYMIYIMYYTPHILY